MSNNIGYIIKSLFVSSCKDSRESRVNWIKQYPQSVYFIDLWIVPNIQRSHERQVTVLVNLGLYPVHPFTCIGWLSLTVQQLYFSQSADLISFSSFSSFSRNHASGSQNKILNLGLSFCSLTLVKSEMGFWPSQWRFDLTNAFKKYMFTQNVRLSAPGVLKTPAAWEKSEKKSAKTYDKKRNYFTWMMFPIIQGWESSFNQPVSVYFDVTAVKRSCKSQQTPVVLPVGGIPPMWEYCQYTFSLTIVFIK